MEEINTTLLEKSLGYHGLPLQKAWEEEKGISDLKKLGLTNLDYSVYFARQKSLTFSDRAKRLRLHQFICKKSNYLFDTKSLQSNRIDKEKQLQGSSIIIPPFDFFTNLSGEVRSAQFYNCLQPGDTIYGSVASKTSYGLLFKVLCSTGSMSRFVADLNIKAFIYSENLVSAVDKKNVTRSFQSNDYICAEVLEVLPDVKKIGCGMRAIHDRHDSGPALGLVVIEEFPAFYKNCLEGKDNKTFNNLLEESPGFFNPTSVDNLMLGCGLDIKETYTNMSSLKGKFPQEEYATELRHQQTSKLAVRSVAEGIEHFKNGRHTEAFQCLNKALSIDPKNVEGLVARGALCANSGYFKKAVVDFEAALKLNPTHVNARKYLCETLVALGRNFEDENKIDDAKKAYQDCLKINPHHEEAQSSLDFLKSKPNLKQIVEPAELEMPLNINVTSHKEHDFGKKDDSGKKEKKNKKEKKKRNKKRHSSSSESSTDSSDSKTSDSSSDSSSSDSSSDSTDSGSNARSKKKDRKDKSHQKSLSPLSKRMAIMSENIQTRDSSSYQYNQAYDNLPGGSSGNLDDYEMKVRKFLEMPRDEDDYEERVRKFMAEASKLQKAKQQEEKASKKKKKKDERKLKKESKKKKKKDEKKKSKSKKEKGDYDNQDKKIRDALKLLESFPNALTDLYGKGGERGNEKDKDDPQSKQKMDTDHGHGLYDKEDDFSGGKWKMMFSKDERNNEQMSKNKQSKQYAFGYDSEEEEQQRNALIQPSTSSQLQAGTSSGGYGGGSSNINVFEKASKKRHLTPPKPKETIPPAPPVKSGPVVLDKFGNFRLATTDPIKPPEPSHSRRSRSRSRKKYDSSSSRSKSRSPRRRSRSGSYPRHKYSRSHSRSYGRRSGSRSRSRSYSRSRSRSRSGDRRRFSKNYRGRGGGGSNYDRGTYYKPRFSTNIRGRGRGSNGNFRDNRDFRGRGRFDRTPYRPRPGGGRGNGNRHYDRFDYRDRRRDSRSRSFSIERERPPRSPNDDRHYGSDHERDIIKDKKLPPSPPMPGGSEIEGRWADMDTAQPEEYDKMLDKARKEKKEEMLERNKDIVKKSTGW